MEFIRVNYLERFLRPFGVQFGPDNTLWVVDFHDHSVVRFQLNDLKPLGDIKCIPFRGPHSVTFDKEGYAYVTGYHGQRVTRISPDLQTAEIIIDSRSLSGPASGYFNHKEELYVTDFTSNRVLIFDKTGKHLRDLPGKFKMPHQVAFDAEHNIYLADTHHHRIVKYNDKEEEIAVFPNIQEPTSLAIEGDLLFVGHFAGLVTCYTLDGRLLATLNDSYTHIYDVKAKDGLLYVVDSDHGCIKIYSIQS